MPTETRVITFDKEEVMEAVRAYCVKTGRLSATMIPTAIAFSNDTELRASVECGTKAPGIIIHQSELAAALILHCKHYRIPIARRSIKSLQVVKDVLSLHLTTPAREKRL